MFIRNKVITFAPKLWNRFSKVSWFLSKIEYGIIPNGLIINLIYMTVRRKYFVRKVKFLQIIDLFLADIKLNVYFCSELVL